MATALIGLGGNVGDVLQCFRDTLRALAGLPRSRLGGISRAYRTEALMANAAMPRGPDFWNAAVALDTELAPEELLAALHGIEARAGRVRRERWEARPLDLDLLFYDDLVRTGPGLSLPHPHVASRIFVLAPLADIAPDWQVGGVAAAARLRACDSSDILEIQSDWARRVHP